MVLAVVITLGILMSPTTMGLSFLAACIAVIPVALDHANNEIGE